MQRHLSFKVKQNTYAINFPTVAQFIDIESMKARLASDAYNDMIKVGTVLSTKALDFVDMTANLEVLCPDLKKDLKTNSILSLDVFDAKELLTEYKKQFVPWLAEWQLILAEVKREEVEEEDEVVDTEKAPIQ
jgi:hypothetical protein